MPMALRLTILGYALAVILSTRCHRVTTTTMSYSIELNTDLGQAGVLIVCQGQANGNMHVRHVGGVV